MFENFKKHCTVEHDAVAASVLDHTQRELLPVDFANSLDGLRGCLFENGCFQILNNEESILWCEIVTSLFGNAGDLIPFGRDWMNRIYAVPRDLPQESNVILMSHLTDEFFQLENVKFSDFLNRFLIAEYEVLLDISLFKQFLKKNKVNGLRYNQGIEMKTPLLLGGEFSVENMDLCDPKIDWEIMAQVLQKVRTMEIGQAVSQVEFS